MRELQRAGGRPIIDVKRRQPKLPLGDERRAGTFEQGAQASFDSLGREQRDVQRLFDEAYRRRAPRFEEALIEARDRFGFLLARAWRRTSPYDLYPTVARTLVEVGAEMGGRPLARTVRDALRFRDIVPAPA